MPKSKQHAHRGIVAGALGALVMTVTGAPALSDSHTVHTVCDDDCDFAAIQPALDAAVTGDVVDVAAGTYPGGVSIDTPGITLQGAGRDLTIIESDAPYGTGNNGISIMNVGDLVISDLTIDGGEDATFRDGIWWQGGATIDDISGDGTTVERVAVLNTDRRAISVYPERLTNTTISDVIVDNVTGTHSGTVAGGLGIVLNGAGTVEDSVVTRAKTGISSQVSAGTDTTVTFRNNSISEFTGIDTTFFNIGINVNSFPATAPTMIIEDNVIVGNVERNGGMYVVSPGSDSVVRNNVIVLEGERGTGIETSWVSAGTLDITENTILVDQGATGILATGAGTESLPLTIDNNFVRNTSTAGVQDNDYRNWGIDEGREVGILISADKHSSRSGDAPDGVVGSVTSNTVAGFTDAMVFLADDEMQFLNDVTVANNSLTATGDAAVRHVTQSSNVDNELEPTVQAVVEVDAADQSVLDVSGNYWGTNEPDFGTLLDGWLVANDFTTVAPPAAPTVVFTEEGGADSIDFTNYSSTVPLSGSIPWTQDDAEVELYAYSDPIHLGTFDVVNGEVIVEDLDLSGLPLGQHTLVFQGVTTRTVATVPITLVEAPCESDFSDVGEGHPFGAEIAWLACEEITGGYEDGTFRPTATVTRQAVAAFLFRASGDTAYTAPAMPTFTDVATDHPFFTEIEWLAQSGIADGYPDDTFRPTNGVTRQAVAAFLYRFADGTPVVDQEQEFSDVPPSHPFYESIGWLAESGATTGYEDGTFRTTSVLTRQAVAAFLYRIQVDEEV